MHNLYTQDFFKTPSVSETRSTLSDLYDAPDFNTILRLKIFNRFQPHLGVLRGLIKKLNILVDSMGTLSNGIPQPLLACWLFCALKPE